MEEILFRGKKVNGDEWIEGLFVEAKKHAGRQIVLMFSKDGVHKVWRDTVGQYIGRRYSKGTEIFEGDVIRIDNCFSIENFNWCIRWDSLNAVFALARKRIKSPDWGARDDGYIYFQIPTDDIKRAKKIGNIHDNPELLENK